MALVPGPEVFYSNTLPEALNIAENRESTGSNSLVNPTSRLSSPRVIVIATAIIATIVVEAVVGVGVGVGLRKQRSGTGTSTLGTSTVTRAGSGSGISTVTRIASGR